MKIILNGNNDMAADGVARMSGRVTRNLSALVRRMRVLADAENNLAEIEEKIKSLNRSAIINQSMPDDLIKSVTLLNSYSFYIRLKSDSLRDIDMASANIAGSLSFLIEVCFANHDTGLKIWVRNRLIDLDDARVLEVPGKFQKKIPLPTVTAILIPFLETTRTGEYAAWFASVRNAIRHLLD